MPIGPDAPKDGPKLPRVAATAPIASSKERLRPTREASRTMKIVDNAKSNMNNRVNVWIFLISDSS